MESTQWYVAVDGRTVGPVSTDLLRRGLENGKVPSDALVCAIGEAEWQAVTATPPFSHELFGAPHPPKPSLRPPADPFASARAIAPRRGNGDATPGTFGLASSPEDAGSTPLPAFDAEGGSSPDVGLDAAEAPFEPPTPYGEDEDESSINTPVDDALPTFAEGDVPDPVQSMLDRFEPGAPAAPRLQSSLPPPPNPGQVRLRTPLPAVPTPPFMSEVATSEAKPLPFGAEAAAGGDAHTGYVAPPGPVNTDPRASVPDVDVTFDTFDDETRPRFYNWQQRIVDYFHDVSSLHLPDENLLVGSLPTTPSSVLIQEDAMWNLALCIAFGSERLADAAARAFFDAQLAQPDVAGIDWFVRTLLSRGFMPSGIPADAGERAVGVLRKHCPSTLRGTLETTLWDD